MATTDEHKCTQIIRVYLVPAVISKDTMWLG
jgi:hypothetical protein